MIVSQHEVWSSHTFDPAGLTFVNWLLSISAAEPRTSTWAVKYRPRQPDYFSPDKCTNTRPIIWLLLLLEVGGWGGFMYFCCRKMCTTKICIRVKAERTGEHNKRVCCAAEHLFWACLMNGRAEWQRGDFSITLMRGKLKPTAWGLQHHYRGKKVWIHLAGPRF